MISRVPQPQTIQIDANRKPLNELKEIEVLRTDADERELRCEDGEFVFLIISASAPKNFSHLTLKNQIASSRQEKIISPSRDNFRASCRISTSFMHK